MYMLITSVFVYVYMGFIFECIYLGIVFTNENVFCFDHTIMYILKKKKEVRKEKKRFVKNCSEVSSLPLSFIYFLL